MYIKRQKNSSSQLFEGTWIYRGVVPLSIKELDPGKHIVKISIPGYEDVIKNIEVLPGKSMEINLWMRQTPKPAEKNQKFDEDEPYSHGFGA